MSPRRSVLPLVVVASAAAFPTAAGAAERANPKQLKDARYCEVFEVKKLPPNGTATIWNSIRLGTCPQSRWSKLDPVSLAKEHGDVAVVLNGPRHFLMDEANAVVGRTKTFGGIPMTHVADIPLPTAESLTQAPYVDRTIERINTWTWHKGRTVFELVAPGGDTYVMQSYSLQRDPKLTLARLPGVGKRITPPPGWTYRTRKLTKRLVLGAKGKATILQDDLLNTYQLATTTRPAGARKARQVAITAKTRSTKLALPDVVDEGTVSGTPYGDGTVQLVGKLADGKLTGTLRLRYAKGSITFSIDAPMQVSGNQISFDGTAKALRGTGRYRGVTSGTLTFRDRNTLDGQNGTFTLEGALTH